MNAEIEKEVKRLESLPQKGHYTCLHHARNMVENSNDLMDRVDYILECKPKNQILIRLKNIHYLSPERYQEFETINQPAFTKYLAIDKLAWNKYFAIENPEWKKYKAIEQLALDEYKKNIMCLAENMGTFYKLEWTLYFCGK